LAEIIAKEKLIEIDANERLGAPIARPSKIVCIGLNYANMLKNWSEYPY
jgi:2-keto-4-pentenoate hydratase/2-oxohepta-3-ene-1,7-dioic acid hydratase in catechol pathway